MKILVLQGPNINMLGRRKTVHYGMVTMEEIHRRMSEKATALGVELIFCQSNHEGVLVDKVQEVRDDIDGIILNPAGLTTSSVSLRDAIEDSERPLVEVHLSNIHARDAWRRESMFSEIATGILAGFRWRGYLAALEMLAGILNDVRGEHGRSCPSADR